MMWWSSGMFCGLAVCRGAYMANDENSSIEVMSLSVSRRFPRDLSLRAGRQEQELAARVTQLLSQHHSGGTLHLGLDKCSCVGALSPIPNANPLSRLYIFDTAGEVASGLQHQLSNLRAVLGEGLGLGRIVLLRKPSLSIDHNYQRPFRYDTWSDFLSFDDSSFVMSTKTGRCRGKLSDCAVDVSDDQLKELLAMIPHSSIAYRNGTVPRALNRRPGLLVRGPGRSSGASYSYGEQTNATRDRVGLIRRLPGFPGFLSTHRLTLTTKAPRSVWENVEPVVRWLDSNTETNKTAVVHVRRGDKIRNKKYCPREMIEATSPQHIADVLARAGIPSRSAVYVMTDEADPHHFAPLVTDFGYIISTHVDFPRLRKLRAGCCIPSSSSSRSSMSCRKSDQLSPYSPHSLCENYLLFTIEKEIMASLPADNRIATIPRHGDKSHNRLTLMSDFLGKGKPCRSL